MREGWFQVSLSRPLVNLFTSARARSADGHSSRERAQLGERVLEGTCSLQTNRTDDPKGPNSKERNMSHPATQFTSILLSISAIGVTLLLYWVGISGADVTIFHLLYISLIVLLALMCTSNMRAGLLVTSVSGVLVVLWVSVNASYGRPVIYNSAWI